MYTPERINFIKLGVKGDFEKECIETNGTIKLGYNEIDHQLCMSGQWEKVSDLITKEYSTVQSATTSHKNQIKKFYEEPESAMWVTFYNNSLWYCFAQPGIQVNDDGSKVRNTVGGWKNIDINGKQLFIQELSGRLTKVQGFRGTICDVKEKEYLLNKINGKQSKEVIAVEKSLVELKKNLKLIIKKLNWKDFEIFIDLIFRSAGWSRVGIAGKTAKTIDLELLAPVTDERAIVQIKSESSLKTFNDYKTDFLNMNEYDKYFFIVHSPANDLRNYIDSKLEKDIIIYDDSKLSELCINGGLIGFLLDLSN
ncbi:hypothetical protein EW093_00750 [Thiospirochaeta perfilievii]|uniref:Restriction endonuclease type IV Mrr domain-containing protein n=1 Tax=Thiospirochaeta perfilievii TaxID=252967 RepID=A0A5C1Q5G0_9SPIO|nr:hypothetical protein [Thiospirochaeta perfilievii]QEN03293.1 hypothetical protein EW093_00750 [Thiospirochaeta perfilievii]